MTRYRPGAIFGRSPGSFVAVLLLIEFLDELVFGAREAAWPLIRADLALSYTQIGALLTVPAIFSSVVEPVLGILSDTWRRRALVLGGGVFFALAAALTAAAPGFAAMMAAFIVFYPASGAFVSLSQAALMDIDPGRREQNMARWTLAGSVGVVAGPLVLGASVLIGAGWRGLFFAFAALAVLLLLIAWRQPFPAPGHVGQIAKTASHSLGQPADVARALRVGFARVAQALRRADVWRWLVLLQFADLMLDVLLGFLALYFVDAVGLSPVQAGLGVLVWTVAGFAGDFLLVPLLEHVRGLSYLRVSVALKLLLYPAFLLVPGMLPKFALVALLGCLNAGWYAILQAKLYEALPGQSGAALAASNIAGLLGSLMPLALGLAAEHYGLGAAMWLLLAGPVVLMVGLARTTTAPPPA